MSTHAAGVASNVAAEAPSGRSIGDILLGRGVITEEQLGKALARQQKSGKPLGQILVEDAAITRMDLASALAEQWGDVDSISDAWAPLHQRHGALPEVPEHGTVDAETVFALREAVDARLGAVEKSVQDVQWREELTAGAQALAARLDAVQSELQVLAEKDDSAFLTQLREAIGALSTRLDLTVSEESVASRMQEIAAGGHETAARVSVLEGKLVEVTGSLAALDGRGSEVTGALETLSERVERLAMDVAQALEKTVSRADELESSLAAVDERMSVAADQDALARVVARLDEVAAGLAAAPSAQSVDEIRAAVEALATRETADEHSRQEVATLAERVADVRSLSETLHDRVHEAVAGSSSSVEAVTRLSEAVVEVRSLVEQFEGRPVSDPTAHDRLDELTKRVEGLGTLLGGDNDLTTRIDEVATRLTELAALSERSGVETDLELVRARVEELAETAAAGTALLARVDAVAEQVAALEQRPTDDARVSQLAARVEEIATAAAAAAAVPPAAPNTGAVDALAERLEALLGRVDDLAAIQAAAPADGAGTAAGATEGLVEFRAEISTRVDEAQRLVSEVAGALAGWNEERAALERRLDEATARLEKAPEEATARAPRSVGEAVAAAGSDQEVERLRMTVERLTHDFTEHRRVVQAIAAKDFVSRMEELETRIREVAASGGGAGAGMSGAELIELRSEIRSVVRRLDDADDSLRKQKDSVFDRIEKMMSSIDWRLQRLEAPPE
ncbi:MAG: hypothetical protein ACKVUT_14005 [Gaiella sp.]